MAQYLFHGSSQIGSITTPPWLKTRNAVSTASLLHTIHELH